MPDKPFTHTVVCFTGGPDKRRHFYSIQEASAYANQLLASGHKCKVYAYSPPKRPVDYAAERLEKQGRL